MILHWKLSKNNVTMKENKIQNFYIEYKGACIENHLQYAVNATGCSDCSKNLHRGFFQHAGSKSAIRFAL